MSYYSYSEPKEIKIVPEYAQEFLDNGGKLCPSCESDDITLYGTDNILPFMKVMVFCNACELGWETIYEPIDVKIEKCIYCDNTNIGYHERSFSGWNICNETMFCYSCRKEWYNTYKLIKIIKVLEFTKKEIS